MRRPGPDQITVERVDGGGDAEPPKKPKPKKKDSRKTREFRRGAAYASPTSLSGRSPSQSLVARFVAQRLLVVGQGGIVARLRHAKTLGQAPVEQTGALELVEAGQVGNLLQAEMEQKLFRRAVSHRPARRAAAAAQAHPAGLQQHVHRALGQRHAANILDLRRGSTGW